MTTMDPSRTPLGQMLLDEISPVIMLLSTPAVEDSSLKNNLTFLQMLSPFSSFNNIDVPVRTASDQPYRIHKFKLRLFYGSDVRNPDLKVAKERLERVITEAGEKVFTEVTSDAPEIDQHQKLDSSEYINTPSWFQFLNKELVRVASFSDHEAFDHPVACLLAVSSKDEKPINRFVDLFNSNNLPSLLNDGAMDPKILKLYLLVHDNQDGSVDRASRILTEMRSAFGTSNCLLLCINSSPDAPIKHEENPWASYISDASPSQDHGCLLNIDDINEIKDLMQNLSSKHIIPNMEQKIRVLNQQVSATRKGFRNQIKNLWWRKGKEDGADSLNGPMYNYNSIESQIRVLGDYAFMLRDYELALSNYRLISTDYKIDKAWKRYAGVQEMMGLTYFMSDQSRKEAEYCMEHAFNTYLKLGSLGQQNATRCGLWWIEMLKARDQYKEAATVYFRICGEDILHSAVMLEQASYCYLLSKPSMLRKYGFHLVLSGEQYKKCDQVKHAIRTYRSALSIFKETTWSYIGDHVHFHIGQWYASLGMYDVAVKHMMEILACSHQSKSTQELFLGDFLQIVEKTGQTFEVTKLQLPVINIPSLKVIFEDYRTFGSPSSANTSEGLWRSLEEEMIQSFSAAKTNWLELQSKLVSRKHSQSNVCVAGEAVKVNIEFKNPLQISIPISGVRLICKHSAITDESRLDENKSSLEDGNDVDHFKEMNSDNSSFLVSEVDFLLGGGQTNLAQLSVTPKVEGALEILGVRWKLSGTIVGFHKFELSLPKNIVKARRKGKRSPNDKFKFMVIKSIPKLQASINLLPGKAYAGDLRQLVLELKNPSEFPVKNLKMKVSDPRFLIIGNHGDMKSEFPACLTKKTDSSVQSDVHANNSILSDTVFLFPEGTSVQGETPFLWPLWFRAAVPGEISLYLSIYYEMEDISSVIKYRTLRLHYNVQVLPSLDVSFQISPSRLRIQEFLVRLDVVNKTSSECFQVSQLSSIGQNWQISLLQSPDTIFPSQSLMAGQAVSCFFTLKKSSTISTFEDNISTVSVTSDVRLVPQSNEDLVYNVNSAPLVNFHHYERLQQELSHEVDLNTIDFVLISRPLKSNSNLSFSDPPHVMSHHASHSSTASTGPISWLLDGPQTLHHDFSESFCEIDLKMHLYNSSVATVFVRIDTSDSAGIIRHTNSFDAVQSATPDNQAGWHDVSTVNELKVTTSNALETQPGKALSLEGVSPYIWSGSGSTSVHIEPMSSMEIPLQICVFSPGTYDLSNYTLSWNLPSKVPGDSNETKHTSGKCLGYKYYLTVLQSA
ncbi:PREDICTED: trafficking protein particle complex subunit 8-like isoform X1 [Lupinus angustifolius]|uniref:trafficking protein particle complex subunit 8-like isoform X1 n=1 Tax=Lupinus angustifolius TaxID=3871 RepID=UPI00092EF69F|nr:PREDICTED: trafficking protein particle complex subunit 8-like isoform X1 [Lupinus angustifolius]